MLNQDQSMEIIDEYFVSTSDKFKQTLGSGTIHTESMIGGVSTAEPMVIHQFQYQPSSSKYEMGSHLYHVGSTPISPNYGNSNVNSIQVERYNIETQESGLKYGEQVYGIDPLLLNNTDLHSNYRTSLDQYARGFRSPAENQSHSQLLSNRAPIAPGILHTYRPLQSQYSQKLL